MRKIKLFLSLLILATFGISNAWAEDYSATHTSNVTFTAGTNGSTAKVIINSVEYDAMKLGTSSKTGTMTFKIPVGTTKIHLHVAGWKSKNTQLNLSANNGVTLETTSITSTADDGVTNNSPFTLATLENATTNYYKVVEITSGATVAETTITIQTTSTGYRAVVWGVSAETESGGSGSTEPALTSIQIDGDLTNKTYEEGDELDLTGLTVLANYESGDPKDVTNEVEWSYTPNPLTKGTTSVEVTATYEDKTATQTITGLTVNEHIITPGSYCITPNNTFWGTNYTGTNANAATTLSGKQDDISILHTKSGSNLYVNDFQTRVYENHTMKISVPLGYVITAVVFTADGTNWKGTHTADVGEMTDSKTWTGANQNVTITFGGTCRITNICVTYIKDVKYALTITEPTEGGTLVVKDGENTLTSGAEIYEGTKLTVTATPETGYEEGVVVVKNASVEDITADVYDAGTLTMPAYAVTISATFEKKPCTLLTTPVVTATPTYNSATLTWEAVVNAVKYSVTVGETTTEVTEPTYTATGLNAETTYTYQVKAIAEAEQDMYCDSEVAEGTFTTATAPTATLTLKDIVGETTKTGALNSTITLPTTAAECSKTFVGWDSKSDCAVAPEYAPGAEYTLAAETQTLYAVYADGEGGGNFTITKTMSEIVSDNGYTVSSGNTATCYTSLTLDENITLSTTGSANCGSFWSDPREWRLYQNKSGNAIVTATNGCSLTSVKFTFTYSNTGTLLNNGAAIQSGTAVSATGTSVTYTVGNSGSATNGQIRITAIEVSYSKDGEYSNFSTTCAAAPKAEVNPTEVTAIAAGANDKVEVTYENVNTESVAVALFNDEACTEAFTADWLTASLDGDKNVTYTVAENTTYAERKAYIKLTAPETTDAVDPAVVVIPVTQAGKDKVFASLAELVAADLTAGDEVTVTLNNDVIKEFYIYSSKRCGVVFDVQKDGKDIKIYFNNQTTIVDWAVGGKLSGTLTNVKWTTYSNAWQLAPANTWAWANLTYTEPKAVSTVVVSGAPTKTTYVDGEAFDPAGLTVTVNYNDATSEVNPTGVTFDVTPATLTKGETSVSVTATYNTVSSAAYEVTGLTVNDIPTKTVAEFIDAEGGRCYLEGIVSNIKNTTYGNFDLTDASGTIYVYGCLNASGEAQKFASLGVKAGDKIKVIADVYELYDGTTEEAKNVQYVSHISAATITIADITMELEEVTTISATVEPAEAEVTYSIKSGSEYISLAGNVITAVAAGTATITATVAEGATYMGNSVDFTVTVNPQNIAVLPFAFDGKCADIATTAGMSQEGIDVDDYASSPHLKINTTGDYLTIHFDSEPGALSYTIKANVQSGNFTGRFDVQVSENGDDYDVLVSYTELEKTAAQKTHKLDKNVRYVKFVYTNKVSGQNVALGNILISKLSVLRADLYDGKWGTLCPDQKVTYMQGASFYTLTYLEMKNGMPYKLFFDEITTDYLEAGKPYLFIAEGEEIKGVKSGEVVSIASNYNGFYGNVSGNTISLTTTQTEYVADGDVVNNYGVINSRFTLLGDGTNVAHERAHVQIKNGQLDCPNPPASLPALAPGARRVVAGATGINTATGVDQVQGDNVPTKMIINGQLFILRGEKMYDAQGKLVK